MKVPGLIAIAEAFADALHGRVYYIPCWRKWIVPNDAYPKKGMAPWYCVVGGRRDRSFYLLASFLGLTEARSILDAAGSLERLERQGRRGRATLALMRSAERMLRGDARLIAPHSRFVSAGGFDFYDTEAPIRDSDLEFLRRHRAFIQRKHGVRI
jgi:hypothetical protein